MGDMNQVMLLLLIALAMSKKPTRDLYPGWYWWFVRWSTDRADLERWLRLHRDKAYVQKALGYTSDDNAILIINVREKVEWTLPGYPTPAPNGPSTTVPELQNAPPPGPVTSLDWQRYLYQLSQQAMDQVLTFDKSIQQWLDRVLR